MNIFLQASGFTPLPQRINRLLELAYNLWWTWHPEAQALFTRINSDLWEEVYHNPVRFLREVRQVDLDEAAENEIFRKAYDEVLTAFDAYLGRGDKAWYPTNYAPEAQKPIAYFSAEFGLHECLPIYSGGLGVLSGDHTKSCSNLGLPLVGIGFLYPQGYFKQVINQDGYQEAIYQKVRFDEVPALPAYDQEGKEIVIGVQLPGRMVYAKVWRIQVGNVPLFLMDTDIHPNAPNDRELSARLYGGDEAMRLAQEMVLGIGGVRALRKLGIDPAVFHMNEGHSAFMVLERIREYVVVGKSFANAAALVQQTSVFTTHTPVPAGHDAFPYQMMETFFDGFWDEMKLDKMAFLDLARQDQSWGPTFSMTVLAMRYSGKANGVSQLHGQVSRDMWRWLWPAKPVEDVPITHVTNGIHTESWLAPELKAVFDDVMGPDWVYDIDNLDLWAGVDQIPDDVLWQLRYTLRAKMLDFVRRRTRNHLARSGADQGQLDSTFYLLNNNALTIGFARRFATYKRGTLIFTDIERLKRIVNAVGRPVQFVYSGKAHPRDEPGKNFIREVYHRSFESGLAGHLLFVEDYDINVGRHLIQGVDVWLNTPRRPHEASGTSGQKAALHGGLNMSISDGWWPEGYNGQNGWLIGRGEEADDHRDAGFVYDLLENEVVPLFYKRNLQGIPEGWVVMIRESIKTLGPQFSMSRMIKDYVRNLYVPLLRGEA